MSRTTRVRKNHIFHTLYHVLILVPNHNIIVSNFINSIQMFTINLQLIITFHEIKFIVMRFLKNGNYFVLTELVREKYLCEIFIEGF